MKVIFAVVLIVIVVGAVAVYLDKRAPEQYACTLDALVCPDGSGVGRTGPECAFSPCPYNGPYIGTFRELNGKFDLLIDDMAPVGTGVTYVLPLNTVNVGALHGLLGKRVTVTGTFMEGNQLAVQTMEAFAGEAANTTHGTLSIGASMLINGVRITLLEVVSDNRCPIDAVCIIAGNVTLRVKLESDTDMETATLVSDAAPYGFDAYQVGITSVMPAPTTQYQVQADEYRVQFEVVAN